MNIATYLHSLVSGIDNIAWMPWVGCSVAILWACGIYSNDRRENPTLGKPLPAIRGIGFGLFMASHWIAHLAVVRSHGVSAGSIGLLGLAITVPPVVIIGLKRHAYLKTQKQLKSAPAPVYIDGGPETWPPAPKDLTFSSGGAAKEEKD